MKKIGVMFLCLGLMMIGFTPRLHADLGPKSSAVIEIIGMEEPYEVDLLLKYSLDTDPVDPDEVEPYYHYLDEIIPELNGFSYMGYASATIYYSFGPPRTVLRDGDTFTLGYFGAPRTFRLAIVTESGNIIVTEEITRRQFHASMTLDLTGVDTSTDQFDVGVFEEHIPYGTMVLDFFIRTALTIGIEILVLFLFLYRLKKSYLLVAGVNLMTQVTLSVFVVLAYYFWGDAFSALIVLFLGEALIFLVEAVIYMLYLKEHSKIRALAYALSANLISFITGVAILIGTVHLL